MAAVTVAGFALNSGAQAQSLFNNRPAAGQTRSANGPTSTASPSGSMFSRNVGSPPATNTGLGPAASGAFVGRSNQGFVGRGAPGAAAAAVEANGSGRRGEPERRVGRAASGSEAAAPAASRIGEAGSGRRKLTTIVPRQRIAFEFVAREPATISAQLQAQLANLAARNPAFAQIHAGVDADGQVRLQGRVPTEGTRKLAAILVRLEPGVRAVHNELIVADERD